MEEKTIDNLNQGLAFWNSGDIAALLGWFAEDVAYCSPMIDEGGSRWVQGLQEVATHMLALRKIFPRLDLTDTLHGAGFINFLLRHPDGQISFLVEGDENRKARRIIVCHSRSRRD